VNEARIPDFIAALPLFRDMSGLEVNAVCAFLEPRRYAKGEEVFRAGLAMKRIPWSPGALRRAALLQPLMAWKVHAAIYWQAFRLWVKGVPFHVHPAKRAVPDAPRSTP
jgi:DUF1365 family protein